MKTNRYTNKNKPGDLMNALPNVVYPMIPVTGDALGTDYAASSSENTQGGPLSLSLQFR